MKQRTILWRVILSLAAFLAVSVTAEAQLGGLLNKAKQKVKEKTEKVKEKAEEALGQKPANETTQNVQSNSANAENGESELSALPMGSAPVMKGFSWYMDKPEYKEINDETRTTQVKDKHYLFLAHNYAYCMRHAMPLRTTPYREWREISKGSKTWLPWTEIVMYQYTKGFVDNPTVDNLNYLAKVMGLFYRHQFTDYAMADPTTGKIFSDKNYIIPWDNKEAMRSEQWNRSNYLIEVAQKNIDPNTLAQYTLFLYGLAQKAIEEPNLKDERTALLTLAYYYEATGMAKLVVLEDPYFTNNELKRQVQMAVAEFEKGGSESLFSKLQELVMIVCTDPQPMPAAVSIDGGAMQKLNSMAKSEFGSSFVKVIPLSGWTEYKEREYPYRKQGDVIHCCVVYMLHGRKVMQNWDMQRPVSGSMRMVTALNASIVPVKE